MKKLKTIFYNEDREIDFFIDVPTIELEQMINEKLIILKYLLERNRKDSLGETTNKKSFSSG